MSSIRIVRPERRQRFERHFGTIVELMLRNGSYTRDMAAEINNIRAAIHHEQFYYFHDAHRRVCGYVAWALLTPEVEQRVLMQQSLLLHESEWNEGDRFWIVSLATRSASTGEIIGALRKKVLRQYREVRFIRPKANEQPAPIRVVRR